MHTLALAALCLIVIFLGYVFLKPDRPVTNYPSSGTSIVAFGDSLISGVGATSGEDFVSNLSRSLGKPIVNMGVPGHTTADGFSRLDAVFDHNPQVVIVLLGGNDYLRRVPREETFRNLERIIERIHEKGAIVLLLGVRGGVLRDNFASDFSALAQKHNTAFVPDVLDGLIGNSSLMYDSIHPNNAGYTRMAEKVYPVLRNLVR